MYLHSVAWELYKILFFKSYTEPPLMEKAKLVLIHFSFVYRIFAFVVLYILSQRFLSKLLILIQKRLIVNIPAY